MANLAVIAVTIALPYTPLNASLALIPLPLSLIGAVAAIIVLYVLTAEAGKRIFYRHYKA